MINILGINAVTSDGSVFEIAKLDGCPVSLTGENALDGYRNAIKRHLIIEMKYGDSCYPRIDYETSSICFRYTEQN